MQNDEDLQEILQYITEQPRTRAICSRPGEHKDSGVYCILIMNLRKVDEYNHGLIFSDHSWIPLGDIYEVELPFEK